MFNWFKKNKKQDKVAPLIQAETIPNKILPATQLGYKAAWLAVKSDSAQDVTDAISQAGYNNGLTIYESYDSWVFVADMLNTMTDFSVVRGINNDSASPEEYWALLKKTDCSNAATLTILNDLSKTFGIVCFFINQRVSDCYAWAKFQNGETIRAFEYQEGNGVLINIGNRTIEEDSLNISFDDYNINSENENYDYLPPDEEDVIKIASVWSTDPLESGSLS